MSDGELAGLEDLSDFDAAFSFDPPGAFRACDPCVRVCVDARI